MRIIVADREPRIKCEDCDWIGAICEFAAPVKEDGEIAIPKGVRWKGLCSGFSNVQNRHYMQGTVDGEETIIYY